MDNTKFTPSMSRGVESVEIKDAAEEISGVHDIKDLWRKMDSRTTQLIEYAQSTEQKAAKASEAAQQAVISTGVRLDEHGKRIESMESAIRAGHDCTKSEVITQLQIQVEKNLDQLSTDVLEGVKTRGIAKAAKEHVDGHIEDEKARQKEERGSKRWFWGIMASVVLSVIVGGISIVWYFGHLDERVDQQNARQTEAYGRVESQVKQVAVQVKQLGQDERIEELTKAIKVANGHETTEEWCSGLDDAAVRRIKRSTTARHWPKCRRFEP